MKDKVGGIEWHLREEKNCVRVLEGKPQGKGSYGRPRCRWVDNNKWIIKNKIEGHGPNLYWSGQG